MSEAAAPQGLGSVLGTARMLSDDRLARRATRGDQRAFAAIYSRYSERLYRYCLAIVGDSQDAQDALQNTMVKVLKALPGEKRQIQLKPWLYRIAHNESIELLRRRRGTEQLDPEQAGKGFGLAEEAAARERLRLLISDLEELPERQRAALVMRELAGLEFAEIAAALDTSPTTARQTLYEARLSLHQMDAGREMSCAAAMKALSDADGRVTRRRDIRAHLRSCADCRRFREELEGRQGTSPHMSPLPAAAAAALLQGVLGGSGGGAVGSGLSGTLGGGIANTLGTSAVVKSVATVAVVAAVGVSATRSDLVDVGLPGGGLGRAAGSAIRCSQPAAGARLAVSDFSPGPGPGQGWRGRCDGRGGSERVRAGRGESGGVPRPAGRSEQPDPETFPPSQSPGTSKGSHRGHGDRRATSRRPPRTGSRRRRRTKKVPAGAAVTPQSPTRAPARSLLIHPIRHPGSQAVKRLASQPRGSGNEKPPKANPVRWTPQKASPPDAADRP